jgi:hypothetical protein
MNAVSINQTANNSYGFKLESPNFKPNEHLLRWNCGENEALRQKGTNGFWLNSDWCSDLAAIIHHISIWKKCVSSKPE